MFKFNLFCVFLLINISSFARDTTLYKIVSSPKPIKLLTKVSGKIVVSRYDGVFEFDGENFIKTDFKVKNLIIKNALNLTWAKLVNPNINDAQVELASDGIYWVLIKNRFIYGFKIIDKIKRSFPESAVRGIYSKGNTQLVSTYNGFYLNSKRIFTDSLLYSNSNIIEENGYFYFVGNSEMIFKMKKNGSALEKIIHRKKLSSINNAAALQYYNNNLYIGGEKGLAKYNKNKEIEILEHGIEINHLNIIQGKLWVAAENGVYVLENDKLKKIFKVNNSTGIFEADGWIVSTSYEGLWFFDILNNRLKNLLVGSRYEKLETDAFYEDKYGNYWISTVDGFLKYNKKNKMISTFLEGTEFNRRAYFFYGDTLYFGSNHNGLISFDIKALISEDGNDSMENESFNLYYWSSIILWISLLLLFFFKILSNKNKIVDLPQDLENNENLIFFELEKYIKDNIDDINVEQIRFKTGLTKYAFYTKFVLHFGKKPKEYLSDVKASVLKKKQIDRNIDSMGKSNRLKK